MDCLCTISVHYVCILELYFTVVISISFSVILKWSLMSLTFLSYCLLGAMLESKDGKNRSSALSPDENICGSRACICIPWFWYQLVWMEILETGAKMMLYYFVVEKFVNCGVSMWSSGIISLYSIYKHNSQALYPTLLLLPLLSSWLMQHCVLLIAKQTLAG